MPGKDVNPGCPYMARSSRELLDVLIIRNLPNCTSILVVIDVYMRYCIALPLKSTENSIIEKWYFLQLDSQEVSELFIIAI